MNCQLFKDAYISAFRTNKNLLVWSNDRVLKTSVMQSYIYPNIATYLNLYMICEIKKFDATFFPEKAVKQCLDSEHGYPKEGMQIAMEHEIDPNKSHEEIEKLVKSNCPLNVLVTYFSGDKISQCKIINQKYTKYLETAHNTKGEYLIILPGNPENELAERWNFFKWNWANKKFEELV